MPTWLTLAIQALAFALFGPAILMALTPRASIAARNRALDAAFDVLNSGGFMRWYDGTQPTTCDTALGAQVLLAELTLSATAFAAASAASKVANAITTDASANATGTATWGTLVTGAGTRVQDWSIGTSGTNLIVNTVSIVTGAACSCSAWTETQAE